MHTQKNKHPSAMVASLFSILFCSIVFFIPVTCPGDVVTDGSLGPALSLRGPDFIIPADIGKISGTNLFHSFESLSITKDQSATFTGPDTVTHVISRVTGGQISFIDGLLSSEVGRADFFLINPSGILFGPNAWINVPAAFHASTAGELRFTDGSVFSTASRDKSTLSMAQPESFGFLGAHPANITVNGTLLEFTPGSSVSLSSSDISLQGEEPEVICPEGTIRLTAMGVEPGTVPLSGESEAHAGGALSMKDAWLDTSGDGGGSLIIQAGTFTMVSSEIAADNYGDSMGRGWIKLLIGETCRMADESWIHTNALDEGDAGSIEVTVGSTLELTNGAGIFSDSYAEGRAGRVAVSAGELYMDNKSLIEQETAIWSDSSDESEGDAGGVEVVVSGMLALINGAHISSSTYADGNAGKVNITADELRINNLDLIDQEMGIWSRAGYDSNGNAGEIDISVSRLMELTNGAQISSNTYGAGNAGKVTIRSGQLDIDNHSPLDVETGIWSDTFSDGSGDAGSVTVTVADSISLSNSGKISSDTYSQGDAKEVTVTAGGQIGLIDWANISSSTYGEGDAGFVTISTRDLRIENTGVEEIETGIWSRTGYDSLGDAGEVDVTVTRLMELTNGAQISSNTYGSGNAGKITVRAGELRMDNQGPFERDTGIWSDTFSDGSGDAGNVDVTVSGSMTLKNGRISSDTYSLGNANEVTVTVGGVIELINWGNISSSTYAGGNAGIVTINTRDLKIKNTGTKEKETGVWSRAGWDAEGDGNTITISATGLIELINGGQISSNTYGNGDAGRITITAGELKIDNLGSREKDTGIWSDTYSDGGGNAGTVEVTVSGLIQLLNGAQISSDTMGNGNAGRVTINAEELNINSSQFAGRETGIWSDTFSDGGGNAGTVEIAVSGLMELKDGARISSDTYGNGNALKVTISAESIFIDGSETSISSYASSNAQGHVGNVTVLADTITVMNNGEIRISAYQWLTDEQIAEMPENAITIRTHFLHLDNEAKITAESNDNVPAGAVVIEAAKSLIENDSSITTSSNNADGGPITIIGDSVFINNALITTSVEGGMQPEGEPGPPVLTGQTGNGGDIFISGMGNPVDPQKEGYLVLKGGFIQANTGAEKASGGTIIINTIGIIVDAAGELEVGGTERQSFASGSGRNVIQAAAPGGEQGTITITAPVVDVSSSVTSFGVQFSDPIQLATNPCAAFRKKNASSLVQGGRDGIPRDPENPASVLMTKERLERLSRSDHE